MKPCQNQTFHMKLLQKLKAGTLIKTLLLSSITSQRELMGSASHYRDSATGHSIYGPEGGLTLPSSSSLTFQNAAAATVGSGNSNPNSNLEIQLS